MLDYGFLGVRVGLGSARLGLRPFYFCGSRHKYSAYFLVVCYNTNTSRKLKH